MSDDGMNKTGPRWMMRNSRGERDAMWTLTLIAFMVTTLAYISSMVHVIQVGEFMLSFRAFDGLSYAAIVLVPLLGAYFGRRYTKESAETSKHKARLYAEVAKHRIDRGAEDKLDDPDVNSFKDEV